jgi:CheY-like chemotaxis protein
MTMDLIILAEPPIKPDPDQPAQAERDVMLSDAGPSAAHATQPHLVSSPAADPTAGCILVVDDNDAVRETLADILESAGFSAIQAADAAQALMIMRERSDIGALVTDLSMPGADGITLIRRARGIVPSLPAILLTGYAEEAAAVSTIAGGNFHVLRKPVQSDLLIKQIGLLIAQARSA